MKLSQWKNFGYAGQDLTPFAPVLAADNLATLANYGRLCGCLFLSTAFFHSLFRFFFLHSAFPLLLAAGGMFALRRAALRCMKDTEHLVLLSRRMTGLFITLIYLLGVYYDLIRHPTEVNVLICLVLLIQPLLFDAWPGRNLAAAASGLVGVTVWEFCVPDPHRLTNIMYCFLAALIGLYLAWHKTRNMFGMLLYAQQKKSAEEKETSTQAAVRQIQPHFISNMLSTMQSLCDVSPAGVKDALGLFADYMRVSTDAIDFNGLVPFQQELAHVRTYAALEQLRFGSKLQVVYQIETEDFLLPALTLQPLVENAITHGIGDKHSGGTVSISTCADSSGWRITVQDDGCGIDFTDNDGLPPQQESGCIGLANVRQRIESIAGGQLRFTSNPDKGTAVTIVLPKEGETL